jgi:hypothetical protein
MRAVRAKAYRIGFAQQLAPPKMPKTPLTP